MISKEIKCPFCNNMGDAYLKDFRYWFECWSCGLRKMLRVLNQVTT